MGKTTYNAGHIHTWKYGKRRTSIDQGHSHIIDWKRMIALSSKKGGHIHRLLKK